MSEIIKYSTKTFADVWPDYDSFQKEYTESAFGDLGPMTVYNDNLRLLYYLLYARYGNSPIANLDENQFKYKIWSTIFQYGPVWQEKLDLQKKLLSLSDEELQSGSIMIYNHAFNPGTAPGTSTTDELAYVNDQNTSRSKRSKLEAYTALWDILVTDITESFLRHFQKLFKQFVRQESPTLYAEEDTDYEG